MNILQTIIKNRSYRRFINQKEIKKETLVHFIEGVKYSSSPRNKQSLKFILVNDAEKNNLIFPTLRWAGYLTDWDGPSENERPSAYIVVLNDKQISPSIEADCVHTAWGIAAQSITLLAAEQEVGACIIVSVQREKLREILEINTRYDILGVIALGYPAETVNIEELGDDRDIRYWRDENGIHHVPKRGLSELIL